jgi:hypothetical protein
MKNVLAIASLALLSGCASMSAQECRGADWFAIGERDGNLYGSQPQISAYQNWCAAHGVQPDAARYQEGWNWGNAQNRSRRLML